MPRPKVTQEGIQGRGNGRGKGRKGKRPVPRKTEGRAEGGDKGQQGATVIAVPTITSTTFRRISVRRTPVPFVGPSQEGRAAGAGPKGTAGAARAAKSLRAGATPQAPVPKGGKITRKTVAGPLATIRRHGEGRRTPTGIAFGGIGRVSAGARTLRDGATAA